MEELKMVRYDQLKAGDTIKFYGANVIITDIRTFEPEKPENYIMNDSKVIVNFTIEPADDDAIKILGNFYSHGTYGGVGWLTVPLIK